jgi:hypothetical protein
MTWLSALITVAVLVTIVALSGIRLKGGRRVGSTSLMSAARIVLVVLACVVAYVWWGR